MDNIRKHEKAFSELPEHQREIYWNFFLKKLNLYKQAVMRNQLFYKMIVDSFVSSYHDIILFDENNFFDPILNSINQIHEYKITNIILYNLIRDWSHEVYYYNSGIR